MTGMYRTSIFSPALPPRIASGGFALFANGTGTASFDNFRVTQYPDPSVALTNAGRAANSLVNWNGNFPNNTSVTVQTSTDNGVTWQNNAGSGANIAGITTLLYSTHVFHRKPSGYYHLSESSGTSVSDSSGNSYNGTLHGGVTLGSVAGPLQGPGESGHTAPSFDGSSGIITLASGLKTDGWSNLFVEMWFNTSASVGTATYLLANDNPTSSHNGIALGLNASLAGCFCTIGNGTTSATATFSTALSANSWYYLQAKWDGTTITLYLNGESQATASLSGSVGTAAQALALGYNPATVSGYYRGSIAELDIVNPTTSNGIAPLASTDAFIRYNAGLCGVGTIANDSFTADTHTNYTQTNGTGGSGATWTWDTTNSRLKAVGGSKAQLIYNNLWAYDIDILIDLYQSENAGCAWGWQNASNYYELVVSDSAAGSPNVATINKISGGASTQLVTASISFLTQTHHRFHMTMLSGVITVMMDENQILTYTDASPFPAGLAGVRNDTGTSYIYLLQITPQPVNVSSQFLCIKQALSTTDPTVTPQITDHQALVSDSTFGTGVTVPSVDYRTTYVSDNIDDQNTKSNYWWSMGKGPVVFQARNAQNSPWIMQSTDILLGTLPTVEYSSDMYRNQQVLKGVIQTSIYQQAFIGDGTSKTWNVANPIVSVPTITLNGLAQTVGLQGVDTGKAFYWQNNSTSITQDNSGTTLRKNLDVLNVAYQGAIGIDFELDNTGQIANTISQAQLAATDGTTGIVSAIEDVSSQNMDVNAATDYANQLLQRYGSIARTITFSTLHSGLSIGQSLPIFIPQLNIFDSVFLVVEIGTTMRSVAGGTQYVYQIVASEAAALSSWTKYFSRVLRSVTGTHTKV